MSIDLIIFIGFSVPIIFFSLHVIFKPRSHGFYRFFAWEGMAWMLSENYHYWFINPFSIPQIISWLLLIYASVLVIFGIILMKTKGKARDSRKDDSLYSFEKTTELIESGIFCYVRHPLYGSLLFFAWGIFLKNITLPLLIICIVSSIFLFATMLIEEKENIKFFGVKYKEYMRRSKMIIPYLL